METQRIIIPSLLALTPRVQVGRWRHSTKYTYTFHVTPLHTHECEQISFFDKFHKSFCFLITKIWQKNITKIKWYIATFRRNGLRILVTTETMLPKLVVILMKEGDCVFSSFHVCYILGSGGEIHWWSTSYPFPSYLL